MPAFEDSPDFPENPFREFIPTPAFTPSREPLPRLSIPSPEPPPPTRPRVFVVHGWDRALRAEVARFLEKGGVEPVILQERSETGQTLIQELIRHGKSARFAVVLATADDEGGPRGSGQMRPRARQNVVLELGYFLHQLGPTKVAVLAGEGIEHASDYNGVIYVELRGGDDWRVPLAKALKRALPVFKDRKALDL